MKYTVVEIMDTIDFLEQQAVDAAINLEWEKAIELNKEIHKLEPDNIGAVLRLGYAMFQLKNINEAKVYYEKALKIQPNNPVANDYLERIDVLLNNKKSPTTKNKQKIIYDPNLFLEIPGKTKSVSLVNLGQKNTLVHLMPGETVELIPKSHKIEVRTEDDEYIGSLPDDLSKRLMYFLKEQSEYSVHIKECTLNKIVAFIKEDVKGKKVSHYSSFPANIQNDLGQMEKEEHGDRDDDGEVEPEEDEDQDEIERIASNLEDSVKEELVDVEHYGEEEEVEE
jgi:hypothetical protein